MPQEIARMEDYARRNWDNCARRATDDPCHEQCHYSDLATQHGRYARGYIGTRNHDIVSAIDASIAVLQGNPAPTRFDIKDEKEALLLLAHFVGDLHQPLHVEAVYLNGTIVRWRKKPDETAATRGGNSIEDGSTNLHAEWEVMPTSLNPGA
jgi:hypothetical protein